MLIQLERYLVKINEMRVILIEFDPKFQFSIVLTKAQFDTVLVTSFSLPFFIFSFVSDLKF